MAFEQGAGGPNFPDISKMAEGMVQLHEMFVSMVKAGFTEHQACSIIGTMIASSAAT